MRWRRLATLVRREIRATLRDPFTMAILVAVPLAALLAFGFVVSTEVHELDLGVIDASDSSSSRRVLAELAAADTFTLRRYARRAELEAALVSGDISVAVVIPPDFERELLGARAGESPPQIQVIYDGAEGVLAGNAEAFLRGIVGATGVELATVDLAGGGASGPRVQAGGVAVTTRALYNARLRGEPFMVAGTFGFVLTFLTTLITAVSVVNERLNGTFDQLQLTPATSLEILLGKLLPLGAVFALDVAIMMVVARVVLDVWPVGSPLLFWAVSSFYVVTSLSLGLIFSATSATAAEAVQKTVLFSVPLVQLSGFVFPVRNMPAGVRFFAELLPATHYIRVSRAIYLRGEGVVTLWPELVLVFLFGVALVVVAIRSLEART